MTRSPVWLALVCVVAAVRAGGAGVPEGVAETPPAQPALARPSPVQALAASTVYPGLGQLVLGEERKAVAVGAVEGFLVARLILEDRLTRNALRLYKGTGDEGYYDRYSEHFDRRQTLLWWVMLAALYGLADAYVDAHLDAFEDPIPQYLDDALEEIGDGPDALSIGFVVRF